MVRLHFTSFVTDVHHKVRIYGGNDTTAPLLHTFSGTSRPSDVFSSGNTVFVSFDSYGYYIYSGFKVIYFASPIFVPGKLQRFLCNSNDLTQWYLAMLLFPLNPACKNIFAVHVHVMQPQHHCGFLTVKQDQTCDKQ